MGRFFRTIFVSIAAVFMFASGPAQADGTCNGRFVNPITDLCWDCMFPLSVGGFQVANGGHPDTVNPSFPICTCPAPPPLFIRIGVAIGFWEPVRLVDVVEEPWCFVNIGGISLTPGFNIGGASTQISDGASGSGSYHAHWYVYPVFYWLELLADFACVENASFDVAYLTELDPLWNDDELSFIINPEAAIFANPSAQAACSADCLSVTTTGVNLPGMFWCAGCHGGMYPFNGNLQNDTTRVQATALTAERLAFKLHRQLIAWDTAGPEALCGKVISPIMPKDQYRFQLVNPVPHTAGPGTCPRTGTATILYEAGKTFPATGEDMGYLIWRKRNCCAL